MEFDRLPSGVFFDISRHINAYYVDQLPRQEVSTTLPFRPFRPEEIQPQEHSFLKRGVSTRPMAIGRAEINKDDEEDNRRYLPLLEVSMDINVVATTSRTVLTQTFSNLSNLTITEATYCFPLYDGSTVIGFRCLIGK